MSDQRLSTYIENKYHKRYSSESIYNSLIADGHKQPEIDAAILEFSKTPRSLTILQIVLALLGSCLVYYSITGQKNITTFYDHAQKTQGWVTNTNFSVPVVTYEVSGTTYKIVGNACDSSFCAKVGDKAEVLYDPKNPNNSRIQKIYNDTTISNYDTNAWRYSSLSNLIFVPVAFIPLMAILQRKKVTSELKKLRKAQQNSESTVPLVTDSQEG